MVSQRDAPQPSPACDGQEIWALECDDGRGFVPPVSEGWTYLKTYRTQAAAMPADKRKGTARNLRDAPLAVDAARYQWLRDRAWEVDGRNPCVHDTDRNGLSHRRLSGTELDDSIDAAMAADAG